VFFDSSGVYKKSHLFTPDSLPILPGDFVKLRSDKILFTAFSPQSQYFGIIDTASVSFCKYTQINWNTVPSVPPVNTNSFTCVNSTFSYSLVPVFTYQPFDLNIAYECSTGPTGPLDPTSIHTHEDLTEDITIFPIPSRGFIYLDFNSIKKDKFVNYRIYNSLGQRLINNTVYIETTSFPIDLRDFNDGVYYLQCSVNSEKSITKKVIISRQE
jgi:hypothetical protein